MQAVRFVVKLYDLLPEDGVITAFDSYGPNLFTGTDRGLVIKFLMEDGSAAPTANESTLMATMNSAGDGGGTSSTADLQQRRSSTSATAKTQPQDASSIFMTRVKSVKASEVPKKRVAKVQHSRTHALLFVLCEKRLTVFDSVSLTPLQIIREGVGSFHVNSISLLGNAADSFATPGALAPKQADENFCGSPVTEASSSPTPVRRLVHRICVSEKHGHGVEIFELSLPTKNPADMVIKSTQELVLPEPVEALVEHQGIICMGMRREYSLLSLENGDTRSILALNNRRPLLFLGDSEVYLRREQQVYVVSMKSMPATGQHPSRSMRFEHEPQCIIFRHPFLFAFSEQYCDVFSLYDNEVVERLPLPGVLFGSKFGNGDTIYGASGNKLWMLRIHSLRSQLSGLIARYRISDAFHLLSCQKRSSPQFSVIERELNVMAGFAHLYHGKASDAMQHFAGFIDIREILRHVPDICPQSIRANLGKSQDVAPSEGDEDDRSAGNASLASPTRGEVAAFREAKLIQLRTRLQEIARENNVSGVGGGSSRCRRNLWATDEEEKAYLDGWTASSVYNRVLFRNVDQQSFHASPLLGKKASAKSQPGLLVDDLWKATFLEYPSARAATEHPSTSEPSSSGTAYSQRLVPEYGGVISEADFVAACRHDLKREIGYYIISTVSTCSDDQRRAAEFALLMLALQSRDASLAYRVVCESGALSLNDVYWVLHDLCEFRLLGTFLVALGLRDEAANLYGTRLSPRSYVSGNGWDEWDSLPARQAEYFADQLAMHDASVERSRKQQESPRTPEAGRDDTFDEIFVAVDHLDAVHLHAVLNRDPSRLFVRDADGNTVAMLAASLLATAASVGAVLPFLGVLVDAGCELTTRNRFGLALTDMVQRTTTPSERAYVLSFLSAQCTIRERAMTLLERDEGDATARHDLALLRGNDPSLWNDTIGSWQGFVLNKSQLAHS